MNDDPGPDVRIAVSVAKEDSETTAVELRAAGGDVLLVSDQGFDGAHAVDLLISLTPAIVGVLAGLYAKRIGANRYISFKYKGLEVKGVSEKTLLSLYEKTKQDSTPLKALK